MRTSRPVNVSDREAEVLSAVGARLSNAQIARRLHISVRTVESHVSSLLRKYGVPDRHALAALAGTAPPGGLTGLPAARTSFIGREREWAAVLDALADNQLVTLLGPGGVGKSRLAAVAAEAAVQSFPSGGAFVDLVRVRDGFVAQAVAALLDVTEWPHQPLEHAVTDRLGRGRFLLVLDNCEHLLDTVAGFAERAMSACPDLRLLVTSRERLRVTGERTVPVRPLPLAPDAAALFSDRARAADPDYAADPATVSELCARLDGLPLAIELAAARSAALGATGLLAALADQLSVLAGGRGPDVRHRSLRSVIGWSHDLLDDEEQALFRQLAVFVGGFDLAAVSAVTAIPDQATVADLLGRLVDKSLVVHQRPAGRWRLLDTVRAFALEQLAGSDGQAELQVRYLGWASATAAHLEDRLSGPWRDEFDAVVDDLRAALATAPPGPGIVPHQLAESLAQLTYARRFLRESLDHYRHAAQRAPHPSQSARDLRSAADCAFLAGTGAQFFDLLLGSAERARAGGDGNAQAIALARAVELVCRHPARFPIEVPPERLRGLLDEAVAAGDPDDPEVAACLGLAAAWSTTPEYAVPAPPAQPHRSPDPTLAETVVAAASRTGDPVLASASLDVAGNVERAAGRARRSYQLARERLPLLAAMDRDDPYAAPEISDILDVVASRAVATGDLRGVQAVAHLMFDDELLGGHYLAAAELVPPLVLTGDFEKALEYATAMWDRWDRAGRPAAGHNASAAANAALAHGLLANDPGFRLWRGRITEMIGLPDPGVLSSLPSVAFIDARVAVHTQNLSGAAALVGRAFADIYPTSIYRAYAQAAGAELAVVAHLPDAARWLSAATVAATENDWAAACLARATGRLHHDRHALHASIEGWERIGARFERACTLALLS